MAANSLLMRRLVWLFEPRLGWYGIVLTAATLTVLGFVNPKHEACIRWWGMLLQFVGIIAVVIELRSTQRLFKRPGARQWLSQWLKRRPTRDASVTLGSLSALAGASSHMRGRVRPGLNPAAPIDDRVAALERTIGYIDSELDDIQRAADEEERERKTADEQEAMTRGRAITDLEGRVEKASTDSVPFSLFGVWCLGVGVALSTAAPELAKWIARLIG